MHLSGPAPEQDRQLVEQSIQVGPDTVPADEYWVDVQHEAAFCPPVKVLEVPVAHAVQVGAVRPAE